MTNSKAIVDEVQRYGIRNDVLKGTPDGEFVSYKDYLALEARVARQNDEIAKRALANLRQVPYEQYYGR